MGIPSPFPPRGRRRIEDEDRPRSVDMHQRVPAEFRDWFREAAQAAGLTIQDALRQASLDWAKKNHPRQ